MAEYIPPKYDWVRQQVELYESRGTKTKLMDTGLRGFLNVGACGRLAWPTTCSKGRSS